MLRLTLLEQAFAEMGFHGKKKEQRARIALAALTTQLAQSPLLTVSLVTGIAIAIKAASIGSKLTLEMAMEIFR